VTRAAKLLKKPDQCRAVGLCSNLFWNCQDRADGTSLKDGKKVNECLRKCLKIAAQCVDINAQFELHVEILNYYMYYFGAKNDVVDSSEKQMLVDHYRRTIDYIKKEAQNETSPFHGISL